MQTKLHDYNYRPETEEAGPVRRVRLGVYDDGSVTLEVFAAERLVCDQLYLGKQVRIRLMPHPQSTTQGE